MRRRNLKQLSRRDMLQLAAFGGVGCSLSGWFPAFADEAALDPARKRSCILLWMSGGPTQTDTFDMKPEHANGGEFKPIDTTVPGIQISEHLPTLAQQAEHMAIVRSMETAEGDHSRATYHLRTGYRPMGSVQYPTMGSLFSHQLGEEASEIPNFVSILPMRGFSPAAYGPGYLGPKYAPLVVAGSNGYGATVASDPENFGGPLEVRNLALPEAVDDDQSGSRLDLLTGFDSGFRETRPGSASDSHRDAYDAAVRMMRSQAGGAFLLEEEPLELRERYGRNRFGQGCLLARRLVERGVPFVEVSLNSVDGTGVFGWDTHNDNFNAVKTLCGVLDPGWGTLLADLQDRGLLETTTVVWMGEFGRTPQINGSSGRDHFPNAWATVLCGGGINGGQVVGKTSDSGMEVEDRPVKVPDLIATIATAVGIDPMRQNMSNVGRPIRIADPEALPMEELLA